MPDYRLKLFRERYYVVWTDDAGRTQRRALRTADRGKAERGLVDFRRDMAAPVGALVGDIVEAYLAEKRGIVTDIQRLEHGWQAAKPTFANLRPDQITRALCRRYAADRRALGRGDATILKELNVVRQALNWRKVPGAVFEAPGAPPPRDRHLTRAEFNKLIAGAAQPHVALFITLALTTAARKSAILGLTWDRVDFERGQIRFSVVGERGRKPRAVVSINERARAALLKAREEAQTPFVVEYAGRRVLNVKRGFATAVTRAGLENVTPHDLRHTAAVWMAEDGVDMNVIAQFLGHTSPAVTFRTYARFSPTYLKDAAKSLEF